MINYSLHRKFTSISYSKKFYIQRLLLNRQSNPPNFSMKISQTSRLKYYYQSKILFQDKFLKKHYKNNSLFGQFQYSFFSFSKFTSNPNSKHQNQIHSNHQNNQNQSNIIYSSINLIYLKQISAVLTISAILFCIYKISENPPNDNERSVFNKINSNDRNKLNNSIMSVNQSNNLNYNDNDKLIELEYDTENEEEMKFVRALQHEQEMQKSKSYQFDFDKNDSESTELNKFDQSNLFELFEMNKEMKLYSLKYPSVFQCSPKTFSELLKHQMNDNFHILLCSWQTGCLSCKQMKCVIGHLSHVIDSINKYIDKHNRISSNIRKIPKIKLALFNKDYSDYLSHTFPGYEFEYAPSLHLFRNDQKSATDFITMSDPLELGNSNNNGEWKNTQQHTHQQSTQSETHNQSSSENHHKMHSTDTHSHTTHKPIDIFKHFLRADKVRGNTKGLLFGLFKFCPEIQSIIPEWYINDSLKLMSDDCKKCLLTIDLFENESNMKLLSTIAPCGNEQLQLIQMIQLSKSWPDEENEADKIVYPLMSSYDKCQSRSLNQMRQFWRDAKQAAVAHLQNLQLDEDPEEPQTQV